MVFDMWGILFELMVDPGIVRTTDYILRKFRNKPPSLILYLHPTHFRFDQQDGTFGYNSPMRMIIEHLKDQTVPHDILEELMKGQVAFYDGSFRGRDME